MTFFRFPHTPHLAWLGSDEPRGDKVLSASEANELLAGEVVVEEKLDGANIGFSLQDRTIMVQNRGQYLECPFRGQFTRLNGWLEQHKAKLLQLPEDYILFGEWCAARHALSYNNLSDWFIAFDVYDRGAGKFLSTARRNEVCALAGVSVVPRVFAGQTSLGSLNDRVLEASSWFGSGALEGFVIRKENDDWLEARAKLVRPDFLQAIGPHWSSRKIEWNRVGYGVR